MAELYTTIEKEAVAEFEEKKSIFIGHAMPVKTEEEAAAFVKELKNKYRDATHNVFAYVLGDGTVQRYSDDGEPQGTAGMPVLDVIRKSGCTDTAIVVTRYFGGTLLGTGGLVHAYSQSAKQGLLESKIVEMNLSDILSVRVDYSLIGKMQHKFVTDGYTLEDTIFESDVNFIVSSPIDKTERLIADIIELTNGSAKCEVVDKKYVHRFI